MESSHMAGIIDPRAAIEEGAQIGTDVTIGPFAVIGGNVRIGDGCVIGPLVVLSGNTTIGRGTRIHCGANIGDEPQDVHYKGQNSFTDIGENCIIREYVTIHRGVEEGSRTTVGNNVMLMAFVHLGHNCQIADDVIIANASLLAGRVEVGRHAFISGSTRSISSGKRSSPGMGVYWHMREKSTLPSGNSAAAKSMASMAFRSCPGRIRWRISTPERKSPSSSI